MPAAQRLAFREFGLAIGLAAVERMQEGGRLDSEGGPVTAGTRARLAELSRYAPVRAEITSFWVVLEHRQGPSWLDHEDINDVMLATTLLPEGFLVLPPVH